MMLVDLEIVMGLFSHCRPMDLELGIDWDIAMIILSIQYSIDSKYKEC
jgi:hypothetical protein